MTKTTEELFEEKKTELKNWQYGTVYKMYDREEECEVLAGDVDRYFDKEFILQVTKQIQSDLLKELMELANKYVVIGQGDIKKLAEEKQIKL